MVRLREILFLSIALPATALATTYSVTSNADDATVCTTPSACPSLRGALLAVQTGDSVEIAASVTAITVATQVSVPHTISLKGLARPATVITGAAGQAVLNFTLEEAGQILVDNLVFTGAGNSAISCFNAAGNLTMEVSNSVFRGNSGNSGNSGNQAGALASDCSMQVSHCQFLNNTSSFSGGALNQGDYGTLTVLDSYFFGNTAGYGGGAIAVNGVAATIRSSTFANNTAGTTQTGQGGAILLSSNGTVNLIANSTFTGNKVVNSGMGAALYVSNNTTTTLNNLTLTDNSGAAPVNLETGAQAQIANSLFARNAGGGDCAGVLTSDGFNLFQATTGCTVTLASSDRLAVDPGVALVLADNGGPVPTLALTATSAATNQGNSAAPTAVLPACELSDARGVTRPQLGVCDIGAFEFQPRSDLSVVKSASPSPVLVGQALYYTLTVTNAGPDAAADAQVSDALPAGATFVAAAASQGSCAVNSGNVSCDVGALAAGTSATITITVTPSSEGTLTNTAVVQNVGGTDPNGANDQSSVSTAVNPAPAGTCVPGTTPACKVCDVCQDCSKVCALAQSEFTGGGVVGGKSTCQAGSPGEMLFWACLVIFATGARRRRREDPSRSL